MKLCVIGLGKMGSALVSGILEAGFLPADRITGCDPVVEDHEYNPEYGGIKTSKDNRRGAVAADTILIAVKPQVINKVLREIRDLAAGKLVISIAAGINNTELEKVFLPSTRTIRVMPNIPVMVQAGISAYAAGQRATPEDIRVVKGMFSAVGEVVRVEESLMDAVTGLSGSGPAFLYLIIEALADAGVYNGLSRELALKLAAQTVLGSARMVLETGKHPGELKDMVTSPAGTTIKGFEVLERRGLRGILFEAVKTATRRSRELNNIA